MIIYCINYRDWYWGFYTKEDRDEFALSLFEEELYNIFIYNYIKYGKTIEQKYSHIGYDAKNTWHTKIYEYKEVLSYEIKTYEMELIS